MNGETPQLIKIISCGAQEEGKERKEAKEKKAMSGDEDKQAKELLASLLHIPENSVCCDCDAPGELILSSQFEFGQALSPRSANTTCGVHFPRSFVTMVLCLLACRTKMGVLDYR